MAGVPRNQTSPNSQLPICIDLANEDLNVSNELSENMESYKEPRDEFVDKLFSEVIYEDDSDDPVIEEVEVNEQKKKAKQIPSSIPGSFFDSKCKKRKRVDNDIINGVISSFEALAEDKKMKAIAGTSYYNDKNDRENKESICSEHRKKEEHDLKVLILKKELNLKTNEESEKNYEHDLKMKLLKCELELKEMEVKLKKKEISQNQKKLE